jgi:hypothetical protein
MVGQFVVKIKALPGRLQDGAAEQGDSVGFSVSPQQADSLGCRPPW